MRTYRNARLRNCMYHVMQQWLQITCVGNAKRALVRRTLSKLLNRKAAAALNAWSDMVTDARERRVKVARALMRIINKALVTAFERWSFQIKDRNRKMLAGAISVAPPLHFPFIFPSVRVMFLCCLKSRTFSVRNCSRALAASHAQQITGKFTTICRCL